MSDPDFADRTEIAQLTHRYAHAYDRHDRDLLLSCFEADATFQVNDGAPVSATAMFQGAPLQADGLHYISNQIVTLHGESAEGEALFTAYQLVDANAPERLPLFRAKGATYGMMLGGRYLDQFTKRSGQWRFQRRRLLFDWHYDVGPPAIQLAPFAAREGSFGAILRRAHA